MEKKTQINLWYVVLALFGVVMLRDLWVQGQAIAPIPYSQFEDFSDQGVIGEFVVGNDNDFVRGTFTATQEGRAAFVSPRVESDLALRPGKAGIIYNDDVKNTWIGTLLSRAVPVLLFLALWLFVIPRFAKKLSFGQLSSRAVGGTCHNQSLTRVIANA